MPSEAFSWPEGEVWLYPSGTASALVGLAESLNFSKSWTIDEIQMMGGTGHGYTRYITTRIAVRVSIGQLYHGMSLWSMAQSATGMCLKIGHSSVAGNSAGFVASGVRFTEWNVVETQNDVAKSTVTMIMPDVSAYGTGI